MGQWCIGRGFVWERLEMLSCCTLQTLATVLTCTLLCLQDALRLFLYTNRVVFSRCGMKGIDWLLREIPESNFVPKMTKITNGGLSDVKRHGNAATRHIVITALTDSFPSFAS